MTEEQQNQLLAENAALKTLLTELTARLVGFEAVQLHNTELLARVAHLEAQLPQLILPPPTPRGLAPALRVNGA